MWFVWLLPLNLINGYQLSTYLKENKLVLLLHHNKIIQLKALVINSAPFVL